MKKNIAIVLIIMLGLMSAGQPCLAAGSSFPDISSHWAREYITSMSNSGNISGYPDGTFKPDKTVSKAEFIRVLLSCLGISPTEYTKNSFSDISKHWARNYINEAVTQGLLIPSEYPSGLKPDNALKRSEAAAFLVRAMGKQPEDGAMTFTDQANLNKSMYKGYIKVASELGLLSGYPDGSFQPFTEVTRAQMCKLMLNYLEKSGAATAPATTASPTNINGNFTSLAIGDEIYNLASTPLVFKASLGSSITVSSLAVVNGYLYVNNQYRYALDSSLSNLDIIVGNCRYVVNQIGVNNNRLVVFPGARKMGSITTDGRKYDPDFIKVYINSANTNAYLGDLKVIDGSTVELNGTKYSLLTNKITIDLGGNYYDIIKLTLSSTDTIPQLSSTNRVIVNGLKFSDISTIFEGTNILNLAGIRNIDFIIDTKLYHLSEVNIDASGKFTISDKTYPSSQVIMLIDDMQYKIDHISMLQSKLVFYLLKGTDANLVKINDTYRDMASVRILKDNVVYDLNTIMVVSRNLLRLGGKQYPLDSTFKCSYDGKICAIDEIDFDSKQGYTIIRVSDNTASSSSQPLRYVFYKNSQVYQDGANNDVTIYTNRKWITFDQIVVTDPNRFTYDGSSQNLIGSIVKIKNVDFEVTDTGWHSKDRIMDIYLRQL
ncbi:S-layer homology domain-containing protein [Syntrophomonas palmitatica]|uniref:S-layer homology domain-containing protein n=1 Tax=Syntrophomonas palmitatica TaxID=402877 RepID=UPI0006D29A45|nr:S-layer homology domain-containing protein [Syntrophomonas palmitatica]